MIMQLFFSLLAMLIDFSLRRAAVINEEIILQLLIHSIRLNFIWKIQLGNVFHL